VHNGRSYSPKYFKKFARRLEEEHGKVSSKYFLIVTWKSL